MHAGAGHRDCGLLGGEGDGVVEAQLQPGPVRGDAVRRAGVDEVLVEFADLGVVLGRAADRFAVVGVQSVEPSGVQVEDGVDDVQQLRAVGSNLVNSGMPAEDARGLLPTNILTRIHGMWGRM